MNTRELARALHGIRAARRHRDMRRMNSIRNDAAERAAAHQATADDYAAHGDRSAADEAAADVWLQVSILAYDVAQTFTAAR